jgi:hypothetical protein
MFSERERAATRSVIAKHRIPKTSIAQLAGLPNSEVSAFLHDHAVATHNCTRITSAVESVVDLIEFMDTHFGMRPDLKDVATLKASIEGLKSAREFASAQRELEAATQEVTNALQEMTQI